MKQHEAELITNEYLKSIYGFSLKHCRSIEDAEDLTQEILLKAFRTLLIRNDIENTEKFIWTIAHNTLCNYYRDTKSSFIGVPIYELENVIADNKADIEGDLIMKESIDTLRSEIAHLSRLQRQIIIKYYFEHKKQSDIADKLNIPIGTVKWHLFEAKKELRKGMDAMRDYGELKFNPIKFEFLGYNGVIGKDSKFLEGALSQNILYTVYREAKAVNQIADELGVSPVYIESELDRLEEYCYVTRVGEKYLCNILIEEPTEKTTRLSNEMYNKAARLFANELFDELVSSDILDDINITGGIADIENPDSLKKYDRNFFLWALIPYIAASSGYCEKSVEFDEVATHRPDGSYNICFATVLPEDVVIPHDKMKNMKAFFGPCYLENDGLNMVRFDSLWSGKRIDLEDNARAFTLLTQYVNDEQLSSLEYAYLVEQGYITTLGKPDELFKSAFSCVFVNGTEASEKLISIGTRIKEKYKSEFEALRKPYADEVMKNTPPHLRRVQEYNLQFTFFGDAPFILSCLNELFNNGKLTEPTQEQKKSLHTIIIKK